MNSDRQKPIGVFDSGIGGLTVLREIIRLLPGEDTIYLGDEARFPYGNKSSETVIRYSLEIADFLMGKKIKLLVVACNTASAVALPALKARYRLPIIGVIEPGARRAARCTRCGRVGVIGTERTIKSHAYRAAIKDIAQEIQVFSQACPLFVPLAEEGLANSEIAFLAAKRYLHSLQEQKVDALVLGCTHYPLLKNVIRRALGRRGRPGVFLVDSAKETAREAFRILEELELLRKGSGASKHLFYVTDHPERFTRLGARFIGKNLGGVEQVRL